jgi:2-iminobutanoate/2-iminopropanoate deaminase
LKYFIFSSAIMGTDPRTGTLAEGAEKQIELAFAHLSSLLEAAGSSPKDIAHLRISLTGDEHRDILNKCWLEMFPDPASRPARKVLIGPIGRGQEVQLEVVAIVEPTKGNV